MDPTVKNGQLVIALKMLRYKPGDVILANLANKTVVKRIKEIKDNKYFLLGDNLTESVDSREYGPVNSGKIKAKIVWPFTKSRKPVYTNNK